MVASGCKKEDKLNFRMSFEEESFDLYEGEAFSLYKYLVFEPESADTVTVKWSSDDETVIGVSEDGVVTARCSGTATVKAFSHGQEAKCKFNVTIVPIEEYKLKTSLSNVYVNNRVELTITNVEPATASLSHLKVESNMPDAVNPQFDFEQGVWYFIPSKAPESQVIITTKYEGMPDQQCKFQVNVNTISKITITPTSPAMNFNETLQMSYSITKKAPEYELSFPATIEWSIDKTNYATIDQNGLVSSKGVEGECFIKCTHNGNSEAGDVYVAASTKLAVTEKSPITSFSLDKSSVEIPLGNSATVNVTNIQPSGSNAKYIRWRSSDESIATVVVNDGVATIKATSKAGSCTVTAVSNECTRTVNVKTYVKAVTSISWRNPVNGIMLGSKTYTFYYDITPADATIASIGVSNADGRFGYTIDQVNKKVTIVVLSNCFEQEYTANLQLCVKSDLNASEKYSSAMKIFFMQKDFMQRRQRATFNDYGTYGLGKWSFNVQTTISGQVPDAIKDYIYMENVTVGKEPATAGAAVTADGLVSGKVYGKNDDIYLVYRVGALNQEYGSYITGRSYAVDILGNKCSGNPWKHYIWNYNLGYKSVTKVKDSYVIEFTPGGTINVPTAYDSNNKKIYNSVSIQTFYKSKYKDGTPEERYTQTTISDKVYPDSYSSYKGTKPNGALDKSGTYGGPVKYTLSYN